MSDQSLYRSLAAGVMLGAVLFVMGVMLGGPPPRVAPLPQIFVLIFAILLLAGMPALYLKQRQEVGVAGLVGAALVFVSVFMLAGFNYLLAFFVPALAGSTPELLARFPGGEWQQLMAVNLAARIGLAAGLLLFGIASYRAAVLPRWTAVLAALGGIGALLQLLGLPQPLGMVVLLVPAGLFGLGWGLWSATGEAATG